MRDWFTPGRLLVGGHRGNPAEHPENTLRSFASAIELGVDVIECDVHLTTDGELAVIHDHTLERTTDGEGMVGAHSMAQLKELNAGEGERIPTLVEVLDLARGKVGVAVEIKNLPVIYPGIDRVLIEKLREGGMLDRAVVISFDHRIVRAVKQLEPAVVCGVLVVGRPLMLPELLRFAGAEVYSPQWSFVDEDTVREVHDAGAVVGVWTVDEEWVLRRCQALQVDAVYTNKPREILAALRGTGPT